MNWIIDNWVELFGAATGLLFIYLEIKENAWLWFVGIVSCSVYIYVFFVSKFYADMGLQFYYVVVSIYGWWNWKKGKNQHDEVKISKIGLKKLGISIIIGVLIFFTIGIILDKYTDSPLPYWDSLTTTLGIIGTWWLTQKYLELWFLWIVADIVSVFLYLYRDLYPTAVLYFVFTVLAVIGYFNWLKKYKNDYNLSNNG